MNIVIRTDKQVDRVLDQQKLGGVAMTVSQVVVDAYIRAKNSSSDQVKLECSQWELNSWPKVTLKLPSASGAKEILRLHEQAETMGVNNAVIRREVTFFEKVKVKLTAEELKIAEEQEMQRAKDQRQKVKDRMAEQKKLVDKETEDSKKGAAPSLANLEE